MNGGSKMPNWSFLLRLLLSACLASSEERLEHKKSVQILMLTGGLLLLTVVLAWFFQEQIGKSFLNIAIVVFIVFVLVARLVGAAIYMRTTSGQQRILS
jgi:O-antigen ligase